MMCGHESDRSSRYQRASGGCGWGEAKTLSEEKQCLEAELINLPPTLPSLPPAPELRRRAQEAFAELGMVLADGTLEQRRELLGLYVQKIKADPDTHSVQISLYPSLFNQKVAGGGFEPPTSGL